jgi:hypothetical protein
MIVSDLIKELEQFSKDQIVVISGYEGGHNEVSKLCRIKIKKNVNKEWYYGKHEEICRKDEDFDCEAIRIG